MDERLNRLCSELRSTDDVDGVTMHIDEAERFFLRLPDPVDVPSFSIHHNIKADRPSEHYRDSLLEFVEQISRQLPSLLAGLSYVFDPRYVFAPAFVRTEDVEGIPILIRVQIDLGVPPRRDSVIRSASNDATARYLTRDIYVDIDVLPARRMSGASSGIRRLVDDTWIGETGRGYIAQGIWMDRDLSRFFSGLVEPDTHSLYPYLPFSCRFRSISHRPPGWTTTDMRAAAERLTALHEILTPAIDDITGILRTEAFSRSHHTFRRLRETVPPWIPKSLETIRVHPYLREDARKEYYIERSA